MHKENTILLPISANVIDSAMFNKIMGAQGTSEAVCAELLGKLGQYYTLFNVPLAVASALGSSVIPGLVSAAENHDRRLLHNRIYTVIRYTMLIAIPSAFGFFALGQPIFSIIPCVTLSTFGHRKSMIG